MKAYEVSKGKLVHLSDEDFEAVQVEGMHTIELTDFVPYDDIDPTFFAHTYLVGPQDGSREDSTRCSCARCRSPASRESASS